MRLQLTLNKRLALFAVVLGALAVLGDPHRGHTIVINADELAILVERELDHVTPLELAEWIMNGKQDYRLIDVRPETQKLEYVIPTAEHVPITALKSYPLLRNEKIVVYSDGGIHAAQAWMLLKARGYKSAYILLGGFEAWQDDILFPVLSDSSDPRQLKRFEEIKYISTFFGGAPIADEVERAVSAKRELPKPTFTTPILKSKSKKKKEGC